MNDVTMPSWARDGWSAAAPYVPMILGALGILIGGWLAALIFSRVIYGVLRRTDIDNRIARLLGIREDRDGGVEKTFARAGYYVVLALTVVALLDHLRLHNVTQPLVSALGDMARAVPSLLKAALIGLVGLGLALLARKMVMLSFTKTGLLDRLVQRHSDESEAAHQERTAAMTSRIAKVAFWVVLAIALVPVLEALEIDLLAGPLSAGLSRLSMWLPQLIAAGLLAVVGYFVGRLARAAIAGFSEAVGLDDLLRRFGLSRVLGGTTAGTVLGTAVMLFIWLNFAISAVGRLGIREISEPLVSILSQVYYYVPKVFVALVIFAIGLYLAKVVRRLSSTIAAGLGLNGLMAHVGFFSGSRQASEQEQVAKRMLDRRRNAAAATGTTRADAERLMSADTGLKTPSDLVGAVLGALVVLLFLRQALYSVDLESLADLLTTFLAFTPNLLVALIAIGAGAWAGSWLKARIDSLTASSTDPLMQSLGSVSRVTTLVVASMIALRQIGVASQLISIAFALLLGAICLALALSFGLGGREAAASLLRNIKSRQR